MINFMLKGKATIVLLIVEMIKKTYVNKWIFSKTKIFIKKWQIDLNSSNYATKADFKKHNRCWYIGTC